MMGRSKLLSSIVGVSALAVVASMVSVVPMASAASRKHAGPGPMATIRVGTSIPLSVSVNFLPIEVAIQHGFFRSHGINVVLTQYSGGAVAQAALASGQEDIIHFGPTGVAAAVQKGIKETIVGADGVGASIFGLMVGGSAKYKSPKQLNGGTVGVSSAGSLTYYIALWLAKHYHISLQPVPLGEPGDVVALAGGKVDAAINLVQADWTLEHEGKVRELVNLGKVLPPIVTDAMVVEDSFLKTHPRAVKAYMAGWWEAVKWMQSHRKAALSFIESTDKLNAVLAATDYRNEIMQMPTKGSFKDSQVRQALG